jgi:hypothetical protein
MNKHCIFQGGKTRNHRVNDPLEKYLFLYTSVLVVSAKKFTLIIILQFVYLLYNLDAMTFRQICTVKNNQVVITLPPNFENQKLVTVVIDDVIDNRTQKLAQLREASIDPLFLADIEEIHKDFDSIDNDTE